MSELEGKRIGQYELVTLLGQGGMASVYRARQGAIKRDVAMKIIQIRSGRSDESVQRFEREAQTIAALSHPHIVKIFDYGHQNDLIYLVMELLNGGSLTDLTEPGPLSPRIVRRILSQIAPALSHAHRRGIIHRDFKPQNILFDEEGNAYLTDFGIAKMVGDNAALTRLDVAMGTPAYMAPEQWRKQELDARTDIYALGVTLFQMLTGQMPFQAAGIRDLANMHMHDRTPSLRAINDQISPELEIVVLQAMAKDREERFASATDLAAAFEAAVGGKGGGLTNPERAVLRRRASRARNPVLSSRPAIPSPLSPAPSEAEISLQAENASNVPPEPAVAQEPAPETNPVAVFKPTPLGPDPNAPTELDRPVGIGDMLKRISEVVQGFNIKGRKAEDE